MRKIYHQCGHNSSWNIEALNSNKGMGLIVSPVNQKLSIVEKLSPEIRKKSIFDPQFYLPSSQKKNFEDYDFFPETITGSKGFTTIDYTAVADESAKLCVDFQIKNNFEKIIIPARFFNQMIGSWEDNQEIFSRPFLNQIEKMNTDRKILQTLPVTEHMLADLKFRDRLLNWITKFPILDGIYLLVNFEGDDKQIKKSDSLFNLMSFIRKCKDANLSVISGYNNTESVCLSLIEDVDLTIGTFENTRKFSDIRFVENDEDQRGPKARVYMPGLFTWIQFNHAKEIKATDVNIWEKIHKNTPYFEDAIGQIKEPTFNQSPLYKHHFEVITAQLETLFALDTKSRFHKLKTDLESGIDLFSKIDKIPISLDKHAKGDHLQSWLDCINKYYREFIK